MTRPRAGTKEGDLATERWRKSMLKKYGINGLHKKMQEIGRIGGTRSRGGGFAANPELARIAGAKGGRRSRRGPGSLVITKVAPKKAQIERLYADGESMAQIARELDLPYHSLLSWARNEMPMFGSGDDIDRYERILEYEREESDGRDSSIA